MIVVNRIVVAQWNDVDVLWLSVFGTHLCSNICMVHTSSVWAVARRLICLLMVFKPFAKLIVDWWPVTQHFQHFIFTNLGVVLDTWIFTGILLCIVVTFKPARGSCVTAPTSSLVTLDETCGAQNCYKDQRRPCLRIITNNQSWLIVDIIGLW